MRRAGFLRSRIAPSFLVLSLSLLPAAAQTPDAGRLGRAVVPTFEAIRLDVDADRSPFSGAARIELDVREETEAFRFHAEGISIDGLSLRGPSGVVKTDHEGSGEGLVAVRTDVPLSPGAYVLDIRFSGELRRDGMGLYRAEVDGEGYAFTQFEASYARRAFPCWDEPSFKIPYQITLRVPETDLAVSNTPVESESVSAGTKTVTFARTKPLPSYLLAMATGPLETVPIPGLSVPGRIVTVRGKTALAKEAVRMTPPILSALERWFGRPYPFEKLDLIAVPDFVFGGMEHPGAITFRDSFLLRDSATMSVQQRRSLATLAAHELAHMWFGDLVTMAWWDDLWLNESFASWIGDRILGELYPEFGLDVSSVHGTQRAMGMDALLATGAIRRPILSDDNVMSSDLGLAYSKGQAVLEMVEGWLGRETFRKGVLRYLDDHAWGNARAADLWSALSGASRQDVAGLLASFLDQPGVPLLRVETLPRGKVRVSQKRFLLQGTSDPRNSRWRIPVILRYSDDRGVHEKTVLLAEPTAIVRLGSRGSPTWVHPNAGERGYYRWIVPGPQLERLASISPSHLAPRERVGLVLNLGALVESGELHGDALLRLTERFASDPEPEVVSAVISTLGDVKAAFVPLSLRTPFASYVRATLGPSLDRIGWTRNEGEPERVTALRPQLLSWLAEDGRDPRARDVAKAIAASYLESPTSVDPSLVGAAIDLSALDGDRALFETYRKRFENATLPADRGRFLSALGSFQDPKLFDEALAYSLSGPLHVQEVFNVAWTGMSTEDRQDRVFRWMMDHYTILAGKMPAQTMAYMPFAAGGCSAERLATAEEFFSDPAHAPPGTERELAKVSEAVKQCVALRARDGAVVAAYLEEAARTWEP